MRAGEAQRSQPRSIPVSRRFVVQGDLVIRLYGTKVPSASLRVQPSFKGPGRGAQCASVLWLLARHTERKETAGGRGPRSLPAPIS